MHDESWPRIEELFLAALDVSVERRAAFPDRKCSSDAALRADAEPLQATNLLDRDIFAGRHRSRCMLRSLRQERQLLQRCR